MVTCDSRVSPDPAAAPTAAGFSLARKHCLFILPPYRPLPPTWTPLCHRYYSNNPTFDEETIRGALSNAGAVNDALEVVSISFFGRLCSPPP